MTAFPALAQVNEIYGCTKITFPGYYELANNISGNLIGEDYCIGIFADNVVLNGHGFYITGSGKGYIKGIFVKNVNFVTIHNVKVLNYYYGIYFDNSLGNVISGNNIKKNTFGIIFLSLKMLMEDRSEMLGR